MKSIIVTVTIDKAQNGYVVTLQSTGSAPEENLISKDALSTLDDVTLPYLHRAVGELDKR